MATNPILTEIDGLSPGAKAALMQAHQTVSGAQAADKMQQSAPMPLQHPTASPVAPIGTQETPSQGTVAPQPMPQMPQHVPAPRGTIEGDQAELSRKLSTGSGISQIAGKVEDSGFGQAHPTLGKIAGIGAQTLATIGNVGLNAVAPEVSASLPGTDMHHTRLVRGDQAQVGEDTQNAERQAQAANLGAETAGKQQDLELKPQAEESRENLEAAQAANQNAQAQAGKTNLEIHDTELGPIVVNRSTGSAQRVNVDGQPVGPQLKLTESQPIIDPKDGKPHTYMVDQKGNKAVDLGVHYERPQVTNINENHQFAEQERGRGLLDAAEKQYRTAQQGAETMRDMLTSADAGNKMSGQMLPLEGALAITTSQGVHRINRTEVDQFQGGGTLYDSVAGRLGKLTEGQPMDASLRSDVKKLTDIQEKAAYQNYKDAYGSAVRRYGLQNEQALPEPGGSGKAVSLKDAMALPVNKGKSEADVRKDIESHGHTVAP